jgi:glycosyltransferase involved in cell wall biosynthesis
VKIALVSPYTLPLPRGNSLTVQRLFEGLRGRGHSVRLFNCTADQPEELAAFAPGLVHSLHAVHPHAWLMRSGVLGTIPWIVTMTGTDYATDVADGAPHTLAEAQALIVFHAEGAEKVRRRWPGLAGRLHIIAQAVQVPKTEAGRREKHRRELGIAADELVLFMAAGLRPVKNIGYALEAFSLFRQALPRSRLLLAGPLLDEAESERVLAELEDIDGAGYLGELPHGRVLELMQAADMFLNTSRQEGMSGAVMEAMAAGLAVVATDIAGNRALITHGSTGILVPLHAPDALAEAIRRLAADPFLRRRLGDRARQEMERCFGCEAELQAHEKLYAEIAAM